MSWHRHYYTPSVQQGGKINAKLVPPAPEPPLPRPSLLLHFRAVSWQDTAVHCISCRGQSSFGVQRTGLAVYREWSWAEAAWATGKPFMSPTSCPPITALPSPATKWLHLKSLPTNSPVCGRLGPKLHIKGLTFPEITSALAPSA